VREEKEEFNLLCFNLESKDGRGDTLQMAKWAEGNNLEMTLEKKKFQLLR
jgi:hypothetical protein